MDGRKALSPGTMLNLQNREGSKARYTLKGEIGRGGSCIVYDASYEDNLGNHKLVRIKECYPHGLRINREPNGTLHAEKRDAEAFAEAQRRMRESYQRNHELFMQEEMTNAMTNTVDLYEDYGTIWIVSTWLNGATLAEAHPRTMKDVISLVLSTARVLQRIHEAGYLYLDLKPENIMTLRSVTELVQLFDFDSMISMKELSHACETGDTAALRISYTKGYAPLELQSGKLHQLGPWSDVFSLGAVLFSLLWKKAPTAFDCEMDAVYDYAAFAYAETAYQDRFYRALTDFFHHTLASYIKDRYPTVQEAAAQLEQLVLLSDGQKPYVISSIWLGNETFYGRKKELAELEELLSARHPVSALTGMGGIGKSTLVRKYLTLHQAEYDAVLYLYDNGTAAGILTDDQTVSINTIHRAKEESVEEYFLRKRDALKHLCAEQRVIVVLDQFGPQHWNTLQPLFDIGWQVLLISREKLPDGLCPSILLDEMEVADLAALFTMYAHQEIKCEEDARAFAVLANSVYGHTLTMELIARQIARSHITLQKAAELVEAAGFQALPKDSIDYLRDSRTIHAPLERILNHLMEMDSFTDDDRLAIQQLAMFDLPGIDASLFRELTGLERMNRLNELEDGGWVKTDGRHLALHPLMQEIVRTWPWPPTTKHAVERMAEKLYQFIKPAGKHHDADKQFLADYDKLYELLRVADQLQAHSQETTPSGQRLRYRILMDAPVDQDEWTLQGMLHLLNDPQYLDDGSILRLYEMSSYLFGRLECYEEAFEQLRKMKAYLFRHPSAYYLSVYHRTMAVMIHNAGFKNHVKLSLRHEEQAIAAVRFSKHPDAKKQLAASLLNKATTLLDAGLKMRQCSRLIAEAEPLALQYTEPYDDERYQFFCTSAMYFAMSGERERAKKQLLEADDIAQQSADSTLSYIEHKLDQEAPILIVMGEVEAGIALMLQAIEACNAKEEIAAYRRVRFNGWYTLAKLYEEQSDAILAEEVYDKMEAHRDDSPWEIDEDMPCCPPEVRKKAELQRQKR